MPDVMARCIINGFLKFVCTCSRMMIIRVLQIYLDYPKYLSHQNGKGRVSKASYQGADASSGDDKPLRTIELGQSLHIIHRQVFFLAQQTITMVIMLVVCRI